MPLHRYASPIAAIVSPRRCCAARTAASLIRSADRHHRIAAFALLALRFTRIRILSIAVAILRHGGVLHCLLRRHAIAVPAALLFGDLPSRSRCSRRFVLPIRPRSYCSLRS